MLTIHCPRCDTALALDPASITSSYGWARCGHCQHVFDAGQLSLPTLDPRDAPPRDLTPPTPINAPTPLATPHPGAAALPAASTAPEPPAHFEWSHIDLGLPAAAVEATETEEHAPALDIITDATQHPIDEEAPIHRLDSAEPTWLVDTADSSIGETPSETEEPTWLEDAETPAPPAAENSQTRQRSDPLFVSDLPLPESPAEAATTASGEIVADPAPATRQHFWRLALGALLVLTLLAQVLYMQRNWLAARWPQTAPTLSQICTRLNCSIQALRDVRHLQIAHSAVVRLQSNHFQMDLEVRNDGLTSVETPMLELSLQDTAGHTWARRILPLIIDGAPAQLNAHQRYSAQANWRTHESDAQQVEAYQVRLVYTSSATPAKAGEFKVKL